MNGDGVAICVSAALADCGSRLRDLRQYLRCTTPLCQERRGGIEADAGGTSFRIGASRICTLASLKAPLRISHTVWLSRRALLR
jgi:hypothetical protein